MSSKKKKRLKKNIRPVLDIHSFIEQSSDDSIRKINQELMVGKYVEECCKAKSRHSKRDTRSPYTSELNLELDNSSEVNKPYAHLSTSKFIPHPPRRSRPVSAPVYRLGIGSWTGFEDLSNSESASVTLFSSASTTRRYKPIYKRKKRVLCVLAFINGCRENYARVTAPDLPQLLIECTSKLSMTSAARKLFLRDGTQIIHCKQLVKDCEVFVSMGEPFKDPMLNLEGREKLRKSSYWTLNGIVVPSSDKKSKRISSALTKRLNSGQKRRILVFRNGECSDGVEVIANKYNEFLIDCTSKLCMTSVARCLYDWNGNAVEDFSQVPMLDKVLQPSTGVVLGPLWVTKGETFSPRGAYNFLSTMILNTKDRIIECRNNMKRLQEQIADEKALMDVEAEIDEQSIVLEELEETLIKLRKHIKIIKDSFEEEEKTGREKTLSTYKFKHINEINSNSRLIGAQSFKVRLYPNGMNNVQPSKIFLNIKLLKKGTLNKVQQVNNFLEMINSLRDLQALFGVHGIKVKVKRAFLVNGCELNDLDMIGQDEQIFLSLGEAFVPMNYSILSISLEKAQVHNLWGSKEIVQRDFWMGADQNQTKSRLWQVIPRIPTECDTQEIKVAMSNEEKIAYLKQSNETRIRDNVVFVQSKQDHSLVLYPEVTLLTKSDEADSTIWGDAIQQWCISHDGLITNKHFKNLYLRLLDQVVKMTFENNSETEVFDGAVVSLYCKPDESENEDDPIHPNCYWQFTTDGYIQSSSNPGYVLTAVQDFHLDSDCEQDIKDIPRQGSQQWEITSSIRNQIVVTEHHSDSEEDENENSLPDEVINEEEKDPFEYIEDDYGGEHINLVALPTFPVKHSLAANQRWGIKSKEQSVPHGLCDKWVRQNLCWPVDQTSNNVDVPIEGYLMFNAPKLKWNSGKGNEVFNVAVKDVPLKVKVLRNGVTDMNRAVTIVIPETKNPKSINVMEGKNSSNGSRSSSFMMFLDNCTHALRLPSAARRVFSSEGKELTSINLERDDLVYASCGEGWIDPSLSYVEQQKTGLLATLVSDVEKIRRYVELKSQIGYIVNVDESTLSSEEVGLCVVTQPDEGLDDSLNLTNQQETDVAPNDEGSSEPPMTAHERSHAKLDVTNDESIDPEEEIMENSDGKRRRESASKDKFCPCKWVYVNGFIHLKSNMELVMGVTKCKLNQKVILVRKRMECPYQRWGCSEDGIISLKYNLNMVLTVATPPKADARYDEEYFGAYEGAKLIISHRKMLVNGSSNQFFLMDNDTGYLHAFATDVTNKNLTATNKAGVCSYAVFGKQEIYQPGYIWQGVDVNGNGIAHIFCDACGKAIRGKENLHALVDMLQFSCAMGEAREKNIKFTGAFQSLNGKVDLSEGECDVTLSIYVEHLQSLREKSRLRVIANELSMAHHPAVRILAYRNGEINQNKGVHIIGRTISEILDLCTAKLELQQAARRLYTLDGEIITHMHQLLTPYYPELTKALHQQQNNANTKENGGTLTEYQVTRLDLRVPVIVWVSIGEPFMPVDRRRFRKYSEGKQTESETVENDSCSLKNQYSDETGLQEKCAKKQKSKRDSALTLSNKLSTMKLYQQPQALKLHVFPNGETPGCAQMIFARNMEELLDNASNRLALSSCARRVYTTQGKEIFAFTELSGDQTISISCGERFVPYKDRRNQIEMRATWSRANRMGDMEMTRSGAHCVDMEVNRALILGQPPNTREEGSLIEYNDGAKTTDAVLTRRRKLLQGNPET